MWAKSDAYVGAILGLYSPLRDFSGDHDCYGTMFSSFVSVSTFETYFDKSYKMLPQLMVVDLLEVSYKVFKTLFVCVDQYDDQQQEGWFANYNTSTLKAEPKVKADLNNPSTFHIIEQAVFVALAYRNVLNLKDTNFYFFKKGLTTGNAIGQTIVLVNDLYAMSWIYASKPWIRNLSLL